MIFSNLTEGEVKKLYRKCVDETKGQQITSEVFSRFTVPLTNIKMDGEIEVEAALVFSWTRLQQDFKLFISFLQRKVKETANEFEQSEFRKQLEYAETIESQFLASAQTSHRDIIKMLTSFNEAGRLVKTFKDKKMQGRK